jgi:RNA polymerase sigma factor (sigma-70 family)
MSSSAIAQTVLPRFSIGVLEDTQPLSDEALLEMSLSKPSAFEALVTRYQSQFLSRAQAVLRDRDRAEDVVQETFVRIYRFAPRFSAAQGNFRSWSLTILMNVARTHYQKTARDRGHTAPLEPEHYESLADNSIHAKEGNEAYAKEVVTKALAHAPAVPVAVIVDEAVTVGLKVGLGDTVIVAVSVGVTEKQGAVDFDDLIVRCVEMLENNRNIREKYQNFFTHIHIDEYQDTNNAQYKFSKLLVNPNTNNICVVGDTDQNIYSWRGANLKNIMTFEKDFPGTKVILLEENYRSTGNILSLANNAIKKNTVRKEKNLFTRSGAGEEIEILPSFDEESEAEWVATKAKELISNGAKPNQIAVLYRTNFQSRIMEEMMLRNDVPYTVLGTKFFERKEVKDILSYLKAALNPKSQPDLKRVFDTPKKGIGKTTIAKLFAGEQLPAAASKKVQGVFDFLKTINEMLEHEPLSDVMNYILVESGLEKELKDDGEDGMVRLANISELVTLAQKYDHLPYDQNIESFFELASLSSDQDDDKKENEGVRLMTIHASKGLEFDYVFIVGLEEDLFPSKNFSGKTKSKEEGEEERRLFYVAVTRARKKLFLTYAEMRTIFGQRNIAPPSQFLSDIDPNATIYHDVYYKQNNGRVFYI